IRALPEGSEDRLQSSERARISWRALSRDESACERRETTRSAEKSLSPFWQMRGVRRPKGSHREVQNEVERPRNNDQDNARKRGLFMKPIRTYIFASLITLFSASGCATFQAGTDVEAGRKAFLIGDNEVALGYFQSAAQVAPDYVY